ncbi:MAG: TonB-dependent receptor, partial [Acidobacteria bacterium]|nr:TonB-dependent receptor [Acidobacteriota bacterium]NIM62267.1 TonB-dependent receptor [Acidobacteriota bacterium]NIQ29618.1 TonB-dependent receptor [Acidobacteriota bacterium]NIQ84335.1 TonB-dependent receptor [Acidobacteriota bacterium]NIT10286.1 TonB-dependent receptor [Acidobacteriota bacterium]
MVARKTTPVRLEMVSADTRLDEVVVVARAVRADPHGAVSSTYLNREELRSAVGAGSDVMRALDGLPGLVSTGDFANFSVRG